MASFRPPKKVSPAYSLERPCGHSPEPTWDPRAIVPGGARGSPKATGEAGLTLNAAGDDGTLAAGRAALPRQSVKNLPFEVHGQVFGWALALISEHGLVQGDWIGVDASTMEANAALRNIVRRDTGDGYRDMPHRMAEESGIKTPYFHLHLRNIQVTSAKHRARRCEKASGYPSGVIPDGAGRRAGIQ